MSNEDSNLDGNWATKLEVYTGVVALEKQVNEQIQDLRNDLNQIKIVLNKLVQKELERESI
jgi:hypothetical protein|tara:strand:- start:385 stop:567 length:183 start_codon:yes stop_codon:yes gene_type:complete